MDLLQLHWWAWEHLAYVDLARGVAAQAAEGRIAHVGMTNTDTDHLHLLRSLGLRIATNQVSFSLLDRRAAGRMTEYCMQTGTRLVCYGSLCGGFLSERWLGVEEPSLDAKGQGQGEGQGEGGGGSRGTATITWSQMKYKRFIDAAGGWSVLQAVLR